MQSLKPLILLDLEPMFSHQVLWFFTMSGKKLVEIILPLRPDGA